MEGRRWSGQRCDLKGVPAQSGHVVVVLVGSRRSVVLVVVAVLDMLDVLMAIDRGVGCEVSYWR